MKNLQISQVYYCGGQNENCSESIADDIKYDL